MTDDADYPTAEVDGFRLGMFVSYERLGDAWIEAPDGSVGTLIWETGEPCLFEETVSPNPEGRWGTYSVRQPLALTTDAEAAEYLRALLPELRRRWEAWKQSR
jgi:hypothetical protein